MKKSDNQTHLLEKNKEKNNENYNEDSNDNDKNLTILYIIVLLTNVLVNFDHGIIPAAT